MAVLCIWMRTELLYYPGTIPSSKVGKLLVMLPENRRNKTLTNVRMLTTARMTVCDVDNSYDDDDKYFMTVQM